MCFVWVLLNLKIAHQLVPFNGIMPEHGALLRLFARGGKGILKTYAGSEFLYYRNDGQIEPTQSDFLLYTIFLLIYDK